MGAELCLLALAEPHHVLSKQDSTSTGGYSETQEFV